MMFSLTKRQCMIAVLAMIVLIGGAAGLMSVARADQQSRPPEADPQPQAVATYSLSYSQIAAGGSTGGSASYAVEDTIRIGAADATTQGSSSYRVENPLGAQAARTIQALDAGQWKQYK